VIVAPDHIPRIKPVTEVLKLFRNLRLG